MRFLFSLQESYREYKKLEELNPSSFGNAKVAYRQFSESEMREIVFKDITSGEINHITYLDSNVVTDFSSVIGYFTQTIKNDLKLVGGYDILYGKVKEFVQDNLFDKQINLEDLNTLRNLSEPLAARTIVETFKKKINELTVVDRGTAEIRDRIKLSKTRPFTITFQEYRYPEKSIFNKVVGDSHLELLFSSFLDKCSDVISYAKNSFAVNFKIDYVNADGNISNYYPDFIVKTDDGNIFIVETKGLQDLDVPLKMARLEGLVPGHEQPSEEAAISVLSSWSRNRSKRVLPRPLRT